LTIADIWVGGYTTTMGGDALGIGLLRWNPDGAGLEVLDPTPTSSPSFLAAGAGEMLYATDEAGRIEAFRRTPGLSLEPIGGQPTSGGSPCHVSVTIDHVYVSNYLNGSIDVFPLAVDGTIGVLRQTLSSSGSGPNHVQAGPHAHSTLLRGSSLISADLGADRVYVHAIEGDELVRTASVSFPPGTGPRDLVVCAGRTILLGELQGSVFALDDRGQIDAVGTVTDTWVDGDHAAGLAVDTTGRFAYTGLRGSNRIAVIRLSDLSPVATVSCGGDWPRHLCMVRGGIVENGTARAGEGAVVGDVLLVANQLSSTVCAFQIDPITGIPLPLGSPVKVASPTFLLPVV